MKESSEDQIRKNQQVFETLAGVVPAVTRKKPFARELSRAIESSWRVQSQVKRSRTIGNHRSV